MTAKQIDEEDGEEEEEEEVGGTEKMEIGKNEGGEKEVGEKMERRGSYVEKAWGGKGIK